jgi:hypothetical protein
MISLPSIYAIVLSLFLLQRKSFPYKPHSEDKREMERKKHKSKKLIQPYIKNYDDLFNSHHFHNQMIDSLSIE